MKFLQKNKSIISAIVIFILAILIYQYFLKPKQTAIDESLSAQGAGSDVVDLYKSIEEVTLDQTLFNSSVYKGLTDFSTNILPQPIGRTNPFDVIWAFSMS